MGPFITNILVISHHSSGDVSYGSNILISYQVLTVIIRKVDTDSKDFT